MIKKQRGSFNVFKAFRDEGLIFESSFMEYLYIRGNGYIIPNRICPDCGESVASKDLRAHMKTAHPDKTLSENEISLFKRLGGE